MDELEREMTEAAKRNAAERDAGGWGYRVQLEVDEAFYGRFRGETESDSGDYGPQRLFLFWDRDGVECYARGHASLVQKMDTAGPEVGDSIVVARGLDYQSAGGTGYSYGVNVRANDSPLPEPPEVADEPAPDEPAPDAGGVQTSLDDAPADDDDDW